MEDVGRGDLFKLKNLLYGEVAGGIRFLRKKIQSIPLSSSMIPDKVMSFLFFHITK